MDCRCDVGGELWLTCAEVWICGQSVTATRVFVGLAPNPKPHAAKRKKMLLSHLERNQSQQFSQSWD